MEDPCVRLVLLPDADPGEVSRLITGASPGEVHEVGLRVALLAAHLARDIEVASPAVESALRRFLAAVAVRVGGLDVMDRDAWEEQFDALLAEGRFDRRRVEAYCAEWEHRFFLYDASRPLLQDPRLEKECSRQAPPGRLDMSRASGSNQPWGDHTPQDTPIPSGEAFGLLLAWRSFGPSGMGAQRHHGAVNSKSMKAAPLRSLVSYHPLGTSLFVSLVLSCPAPAGQFEQGADLAPWEADELEDPLVPRPVSGPVSLLVGRTAHHVLLAPDELGAHAVGCWVAWGTQRDLPAARDPFVLDRAKGGPKRADYRRALLRDFDAFVHAQDPAAAGVKGVVLPGWLSVYADLPGDVLARLGAVRVRALGCHQEKQDRNKHWYAATTPESIAPYLPARHPGRAQRVVTTRQSAELVATDLAKVLRTAWRAVTPAEKECGWADAATATFWDRAEARFWSAIADDDAKPPRFRPLAVEIFDELTAPAALTPQAMHPIAKARAALINPRSRRAADS